MAPSKRAAGKRWSEADLLRRLTLALKVAARAVRELAPEGYADPQESDAQVSSAKVVAETALLLLAAARAARFFPDLNPPIREIAAVLVPHARSERLAFLICTRPALALDHGFAHVCLSALGYRDDRFDALLSRSASALVATSCERLPHREMEQRWIRSVRGVSAPSASSDAALTKLSMLGRPLDALSASRDDLYAFTHALLYATDLGLAPGRVRQPKRPLLADTEAALARCLDFDDFDLAGELLLAWPLLGARWSRTASFAFRALARVEDQVGFLPAPITRLDRYRGLVDAGDRSRYALATAYHTAYVMGLLCAAVLSARGSAPATGWDRPRGRKAPDLRRLLDLLAQLPLRADGTQPQWTADFDRLSPHEQLGLGPFLATVLLQRAARSGDLALVHRTLETISRCGYVSGPAARQAAQLLQRAATLAPALTRLTPLPPGGSGATRVREPSGTHG